MNVTQAQYQIENHIQCNLSKLWGFPFFKQAKNDFLNHIEILDNDLWMILIQTLHDFSVPLNMIFIFNRKNLFDSLKHLKLIFLLTLLPISFIVLIVLPMLNMMMSAF